MPEGPRLGLSVALATLLAPSLWGADIVQPATAASLAFGRYIAGIEQTNTRTLETVEIEAWLPKLAAHARMRAIRRLTALGKPEYQVLENSGDLTVQKQVIARYLSAELRAATVPAASVAIIPANYKFHYRGYATDGENVVYIFRITPLQKREGLIKGEVWIDGGTGAAVRQSGYLVKSPSVFVKRIEITRETPILGERTTRVSINTRLLGHAELNILEHPYWEN
jgi:hypothetical protein